MPFTVGGDWIASKKEVLPIKIFLQKRKGAWITCVKNLPFKDQDLKDLISELKKHLASGGSFKEGVLELQGDHKEAVCLFLEKKGLKLVT